MTKSDVLMTIAAVMAVWWGAVNVITKDKDVERTSGIKQNLWVATVIILAAIHLAGK